HVEAGVLDQLSSARPEVARNSFSWKRGRLAVVAAAEQLIRPMVDRLSDKVYRAIDEAEVAPLGMVGLKSPRRIPVVDDVQHGLVGVRWSTPAATWVTGVVIHGHYGGYVGVASIKVGPVIRAHVDVVVVALDQCLPK